MKHVKWLTILLLCSVGYKTYAQLGNNRSYQVISAYMQGFGKLQGTYWLEEWSFPFRNSNIDLLKVLDISYLETPPYWGDDNIKMDSLFSEADLNSMKELCARLPGRYRWNTKKLSQLGLPTGDTVVPRTLEAISQVHIRICPPLFSLDNKKAILYAEFHSEGTGGEGNVLLYVKKKNEWVLVRILNVWVS